MEDNIHNMFSTTKVVARRQEVVTDRTYMVYANAYHYYDLSEVKGLNRLTHLSIEPLVVQLTYP